MKRAPELQPDRYNKRRRTETVNAPPQQPVIPLWTSLQSGLQAIAQSMQFPFRRGFPELAAPSGGSLALFTQQRQDVIEVDDASEADPEDDRLRAEQTMKRSEARRHLNDLRPVDVHPGLAKPLFHSSFNGLAAPQPSSPAGPSRPNVDYAPQGRDRQWMRSVSPASSTSSISSSPHKTNLRTTEQLHRQASMFKKFYDDAIRVGDLARARQVLRSRDDLLRNAPKSRNAFKPQSSRRQQIELEKAVKSLSLGDPRKQLDELVTPPIKKFEPPRPIIKPRQETKKKPYNDFVEQIRLADAEKEKRIKDRLQPKIPSKLEHSQEIIANERLDDPHFKAIAGAAEVDARSLRKLCGLDWLNDDIVGFYIELINARAKAEGQKVVGMNTFFYQKLSEQGYAAANLKRWTKRMKVDIFALDKLLVPINIGNMHWVCAVINFGDKRIEYYDSMADNGHRFKVFQHLRSYLQAEHKEKKGSSFDLSGWEDHFNPKTPRQKNGSDCGVFACQTLESAARGKDLAVNGFEFTGDNMGFFRMLMVVEIASGELSKRFWG